MRRVPLKIVDIIDQNGRDNKMSYLEIFQAMARVSPPGGGLTADEMDTPLALTETLANVSLSSARSVMLEETEWTYLSGRLKANRWPFVSRVIQAMIADVENAEKVDPNAKTVAAAN